MTAKTQIAVFPIIVVIIISSPSLITSYMLAPVVRIIIVVKLRKFRGYDFTMVKISNYDKKRKVGGRESKVSKSIGHLP